MRYFILLNLLSFFTFAQSQNPKKPNSFLLNFGSGTFTTVEYERDLLGGSFHNYLLTSLGAGMGAKIDLLSNSGSFDSSQWSFVATQKISYCMGSGVHFVELGLGGNYIQISKTQPYIVYPFLGYRFIGTNNTTLKLHVSLPFTGIHTDDLGFLPIGLGLGQFF